MDPNALLEVDGLSISFQSPKGLVNVARNISFSVKQGRTLAIVGESGSGKSVSMLSLLSLLQKNKVVFPHGEFHFDPLLFDKTSKEEIRILPGNELLKKLRGKEISMIFQEPMTSLNPVLTCGEQISEMLRQHNAISGNDAKLKAIDLFTKVKLPRPAEMYDQYPYQLSGGQRQRVMIAMAISCNPKILIADEPTTALDVTVQKEILLLLKSLQEENNMALVFITHDLGVVAEIADDIVVMQRGELVESGIAKEVLLNPKHPYTRGLLACRPNPDQKKFRLSTLSDFTDQGRSKNEPRVENPVHIVHDDLLLEVNHVYKKYEASLGIFKKGRNVVTAVNDVSFQIRRGEVLGLVGESGCGKTTLSRMLLGLIPASEGQILFHLNGENSEDITNLTQKQIKQFRKKIQIIFQDPYSALNPKHTIGSSIVEPMTVFGLHQNSQNRKEKAIELLEKVGLGSEHFDRYPHEFSGGQRQRIVIARALACEPSFIICDESVSALDVSVQAQVLNLLKDLQRDFNLTYLFISHDLNVVYYMSDRIMVMNKGCIEEIGEAQDVFFSPKSAYTQRLISAIPGRTVVSS